MLPKWLSWTLGAALAAGLTAGVYYIQERGVPYLGLHATLLWVELLLVPVTLLMTVVVFLRGRRGENGGEE